MHHKLRPLAPGLRFEWYISGERMGRIARLLPFMMPTESTETDLDWTRLQGTVLEGGYQLESISSADAAGASFKVRVLGDSSANTIAKLFGMNPINADTQVADWVAIRELGNANLWTPLAAGQTRIDAATVAYLVLKRPDETLEDVVRERPLTSEEAGEVLLALIAGLNELHSHAFVHRCVSPDHIVAVGNAVKLSVDCAGKVGHAPTLQASQPKYSPPESGGQNVTPEADVWCLGATLVEILSQRDCGEDCMAQAASLPAPFDSVARRCLDADPQTRAKLTQMEALFRSHRAPVSESKKSESVVVPAPIPASAARPAPAQRATPPARANIFPVWMYAAAAVAVVLALILLLRPKHRPVPPKPVAALHSASPAQPRAWESKTIPPEDAKTLSPAPAATRTTAPPTRQPSFLKGPVWRVVLYAYTRSADADAKAHWVNGKYSGLNAETFSPSGGTPYLVVVGGRMSREEAERLRQRVRALGLPRDSYIQNYRQ